MVNTFEEMLRLAEKQNSQPKRTPHKNEEHKIQCACVRWFRHEYPHLALSLFSIPNGGLRNKAVATAMKKEGLLAGVLDLCLAIPIKGCGALFIEMKTEQGKLSDLQKQWISHAKKFGYICVAARSLDDFIYAIVNYLSGNHDALNKL